MNDIPHEPRTGRAVPRGLAQTGPVLFSYGFRPFFFGAGVWAVAAMALWIGALVSGWPIGGDYGAPHWHAHEMLFGFAPAVLAGFLMTAVPNWTGRLPVSGPPLMVLFSIWVAGRLAMLSPDLLGVPLAAAIDALFLPALLFINAREIIAGRKWRDLKVLGGLAALALANIFFHRMVIIGVHDGFADRLAVSAYVMLIMIIGGRIVPSFTRNWLNKAGRTVFPVPFNRFDSVAITSGGVALAAWIFEPAHPVTALAAALAAGLHVARLSRWRGWETWAEKLLVILHVGYAFVPLGFLGIALGATGLLDDFSVLHILTVGAIGVMMLAVITRVTRGHTGRQLSASTTTALSYLLLIAAAVLRPLADLLPDLYEPMLAMAGLAWIVAFGLFLLEHGPMLLTVRRTPLGAG